MRIQNSLKTDVNSYNEYGEFHTTYLCTCYDVIINVMTFHLSSAILSVYIYLVNL